MKIRTSFVSNSSSSSFIITNNSDEDLTLMDFVKETLFLFDKYKKMPYIGDECNETYYDFLEEAERLKFNDIIIKSKSNIIKEIDDYDERLVHNCYYHTLQKPGKTKSFSWKEYEY